MIRDTVAALRREVSALHAELVRYRLVVWTAGNVSGPGARHGPYGHQTERSRLRRPHPGRDDRLRPRRYGRRRRPAPVQRHGRARATSTGTCPTSAASCTPTPRTPAPGRRAESRCRACSPAMADEFGGEIPVGPFALIGDDSSARGIVATLSGHRSPAVLMRNHGVFTIGRDRPGRGQGGGDVRGRGPHASTWPPARRAGADRAGRHRPALRALPERLRPDAEPTEVEGDRVDDEQQCDAPRSGSSPAARRSTARRPCARWPSSPRPSPGRLRRRPRPVRCGWSGGRSSPTPRRSAGCAWTPTPDDNCVGVIAWMHTFSPAKMWIAGLGRAGQAAAAPAHAGQRGACRGHSIDMDFMNLNQAAHGDREFGYIQARLGVARTTVAGHVERPAGAPAGRRVGAGGERRGPTSARCGWPGSATTCATSRSPRATRSRPSGASASRSTPTA